LLQFDISDREDCRNKLEAWSQGPFWGVVCNAGINADNAFPALSGEDWDQVIHTNLDGFYNVLHPLIMPLCRRKQGRIITVSSVSGIMGNRGQVNYSASKAGIIGATKALAVELASRSITVNCIAPGIIETDMIKDAPLDMILPAIPMGRVGKPEEVAALAVFLLSGAAAYITRQVISVNGGLL
ncbi:MAG: 3-oxoacyl-ACP reductase FabG, partial [Treponema sp.]|nr:3-oxoacyl-ACP reductase FabG [Treponema sp.]